MNIEKKKYKKPEFESVSFEDEDIITCSGIGEGGESGGTDEDEKPPIDLPIIPFL